MLILLNALHDNMFIIKERRILVLYFFKVDTSKNIHVHAHIQVFQVASTVRLVKT